MPQARSRRSGGCAACSLPTLRGGCAVTLGDVRTCMVLLVMLGEIAEDNGPLCGSALDAFFYVLDPRATFIYNLYIYSFLIQIQLNTFIISKPNKQS